MIEVGDYGEIDLFYYYSLQKKKGNLDFFFFKGKKRLRLTEYSVPQPPSLVKRKHDRPAAAINGYSGGQRDTTAAAKEASGGSLRA